MDNKTAFWLALAILLLFAADYLFFGWGLPLAVGKLIAQLSEWLAFWR